MKDRSWRLKTNISDEECSRSAGEHPESTNLETLIVLVDSRRKKNIATNRSFLQTHHRGHSAAFLQKGLVSKTGHKCALRNEIHCATSIIVFGNKGIWAATRQTIPACHLNTGDMVLGTAGVYSNAISSLITISTN